MGIITQTQAQDYKISFAAMGDTNVLSSVRVENLTRGNSVIINSGDTLHLKSSLGIKPLETEDYRIQLYPNPITDQSILTFVSTEEGNAQISVVDMAGKTIYHTQKALSTGKHNFRISGIESGTYFVNIASKNYTRSIQIVSQSQNRGKVEIEAISSIEDNSEKWFKSTESIVEMVYNNGDLLLLEATAGSYKAILTDIPAGSKTITFNFSACYDFDGNNYPTVVIGNQTWMAENLKTSHFSDGAEITQVQGDSEWSNMSYTDQAYCYYDNSITNGNTFGALYTWAAAMKGAQSSDMNPSNVQGACPCGWHMPSDEEWIELEMYLGMSHEEAYALGWRGSNEGDKLKTAFGWYNDGNGTNTSGFSALPGGSRKNGLFDGLTKTTIFWSSTEYFNITHLAFNRSLSYLYSQVGWFSAAHYYGYPKNFGLSVRCLKD